MRTGPDVEVVIYRCPTPGCGSRAFYRRDTVYLAPNGSDVAVSESDTVRCMVCDAYADDVHDAESDDEYNERNDAFERGQAALTEEALRTGVFPGSVR